MYQKMLSVFFTFIILLVASFSNATERSLKLEGYPMGFISDCPGSLKPAFIKPKSLKHLSFTLVGNSQRRRYNYYQMKLLDKDPEFDKEKKTIIYVGGYLDSPAFFISSILSRPYKDFGYNVLLLDTVFFTTVEYPVAARFARPVGKHVAEMLTELTKMGLDPKRTELLGLSLGGQTMSIIAKHYQSLNNRKISRLTGLDPAGPCFRNLGPELRLNQTDADFVEVIMTNIDGFGIATPVGHVNFYVNGGEYQPGDIFWVPCNILCSHLRAVSLWTSAFYNRNKFIAMKCESVQKARQRDCYDNVPLVTNVLGPNVDKNNTGIFYLSTDNDFPYYLGENGLKKENDFFIKKLNSLNAKNVMKM